MPVFIAKGTKGVRTPELSNIPNSSVNIRVQQDNDYSDSPVLTSIGGIVSFVQTNTQDVGIVLPCVSVQSRTSFLYGQIYGIDLVTSSLDIGQGVLNDFGLITTDINLSYGMWNSFDFPATVLNVQTDTSQGVSISYPTVGTVLDPRQEIVVEGAITKDGVLTVDSDIVITTNLGSATYSVKGVRIEGFFMSEPNWEDGMSVNSKFLTSVSTSSNRSEGRKVLRPLPVRTVDQTFHIVGKDSVGQAWAALRDATQREKAYPYLPDKSAMSQAPDVRRVYCPTDYRHFSDGRYALLYNTDMPDRYNTVEVVRIVEVFSDGFSTESDILGSYIKGSFACPAFIGRALPSDTSVEIATDNKASIPLSIHETYGTYTLPSDSSYTPVIKNGLPLMEWELTWTEPPSQVIGIAGGFSESGRGFYYSTEGTPYITQSATAICRDKEESWDLENFFNYIKGRGRPFWAVSVLDFLEVTGSVSNTEFTISNPNPESVWQYLNYVKATDSNGDFEMLEVINYATVGDTTTITLESNSLVDIAKAVQAHKVRLESDEITEEYLTDSVSLCSFTVQELQAL